MLLAEKYIQTDTSASGNCRRNEGLALGIEIIKKHKEGLSAIQIAIDCGCSLDDVMAVTENL